MWGARMGGFSVLHSLYFDRFAALTFSPCVNCIGRWERCTPGCYAGLARLVCRPLEAAEVGAAAEVLMHAKEFVALSVTNRPSLLPHFCPQSACSHCTHTLHVHIQATDICGGILRTVPLRPLCH